VPPSGALRCREIKRTACAAMRNTRAHFIRKVAPPTGRSWFRPDRMGSSGRFHCSIGVANHCSISASTASACKWLTANLVPEKGLEPLQPFGHWNLNPVPGISHFPASSRSSFVCLAFRLLARLVYLGFSLPIPMSPHTKRHTLRSRGAPPMEPRVGQRGEFGAPITPDQKSLNIG
jgi:hypothetical protein